MKRYLLLITLFCFTASFAQENKVSWYKLLKGSIDKYPLTMQLYKAGHKYQASYYYDAQQKLIYLSGDDTSTAGKIRLVGITGIDDVEEEFLITLTSNIATGSWKKSNKKNMLTFKAVESNIFPSFTYVFTQGTAKLRPKWKDTPEATYEAASVWPVDSSHSSVIIKQEIIKLLQLKNTNEAIGALLLKDKKRFFSDYQKDLKEVKDSDIRNGAEMYNYEVSNELLIAFRNNKLLVLELANYAYTGGAHGNHGNSYTCINLVDNKVITLNDIIKEGSKKKLNQLLEKHFRKDYNVKPADPLTDGGLFENNIKPNNNFYITGKGIGFCYNPYEIGPYAMGTIDIFIPFTELQSDIKDGFKILVEAN